MKLSPGKLLWRSRRNLSAFTLTEMMIASTLYLVVLTGVMGALHVCVLRMYSQGAAKLAATQSSRKVLNQIRDDIRQGKSIKVGNCTSDGPASFTAVAVTNGVMGNALQIFQTADQTAPYSIYYLQTNSAGGPSSNSLMAYLATTNTSTALNLATGITNSIVFSAEDCYGNTVSNSLPDNRQVFKVTLQFSQREYSGGLDAYNHYQLSTKVCPRT